MAGTEAAMAPCCKAEDELLVKILGRCQLAASDGDAGAAGCGETTPMHALQRILRMNRANRDMGIMAACTANRWAIRAVLAQACQDRTTALVEATARQVNLAGGYAGLRPHDFVRLVRQEAERVGLPPRRVILGGDHLGPAPWCRANAAVAMARAGKLTAALVRCGFVKLHVDTTTPCKGDPATDGGALPLELIIQRTAALVAVAEEAARRFRKDPPLYVVGSDVPSPGGRAMESGSAGVTASAELRRMLVELRRALRCAGLDAVWPRIAAVVVRPGIDFASLSVEPYNPRRIAALVRVLQDWPGLVFEAHSTDFQDIKALRRMVNDHFALLKVGPALTFAFREAVFALAHIEAEVLRRRKGSRLSGIVEAVDGEMVRDPIHWQHYYRGSQDHKAFLRRYAYSDRIRYYWARPGVRAAFSRLLGNLRRHTIPSPLIHQYLTDFQGAARDPEELIVNHVGHVTRRYAAACGRTPASTA
jgi:D-tagatose-1,6-bisphosphate aldolase subunit GatZ/KbaZ